MTINVLTLFPEMFESVKASSIWARAIGSDTIEINTVNIRDYTTDKHNRADDYPFGGGAGMVLKPEPVCACFEDVISSCPKPFINVYMSPCGKTLSHDMSVDLSKYACVNILCGHYEGVDKRAIEKHIDMQISIGDYVLTGGELAAMVVIDAAMRHIGGVLGNDQSAENESFSHALLEHPQYTRPAVMGDKAVPEVLLSGHHAKIEQYNRQMSLRQTAKHRPELLSKTVLREDDIGYITQK